jgi:hypothetical protein
MMPQIHQGTELLLLASSATVVVAMLALLGLVVAITAYVNDSPRALVPVALVTTALCGLVLSAARRSLSTPSEERRRVSGVMPSQVLKRRRDRLLRRPRPLLRLAAARLRLVPRPRGRRLATGRRTPRRRLRLHRLARPAGVRVPRHDRIAVAAAHLCDAQRVPRRGRPPRPLLPLALPRRLRRRLVRVETPGEPPPLSPPPPPSQARVYPRAVSGACDLGSSRRSSAVISGGLRRHCAARWTASEGRERAL